MSNSSIAGVSQIFASALAVFGRQGFQRTSMAEVAKTAGMSRAALYLRFADKAALFQGLAEWFVSETLTAAESAWQEGAALAPNLEATILAKDLPFYRMLHASPHGAALLAVDAEMTRAHAQRLDHGFGALLECRAGEVLRQGGHLEAFGGPAGFSAFLVTAAGGLKHELPTEARYRDAVRRLCLVVSAAAGLTGKAFFSEEKTQKTSVS